MGTTTTNYGLKKPTPGSEELTWGTDTNDNMDTIDATIASVSGVANSASASAGTANTTINDHISDITTIVNVTGTSHDLDAANKFAYHRCTSTSAKTLNIRTNATHAIDVGSQFDFRNIGTSDLTIVPASGVTVNLPTDGTLVVPTGGTVSLKKVGTDEFDLVGQTVPAE